MSWVGASIRAHHHLLIITSDDRARRMMQIQQQQIGVELGHLTVMISGMLHAIPIKSVVEILPALRVDTVAGLPSFIKGVVFVRGHLIPVMSAAKRLNHLSEVPIDEPHLICLRAQGRVVGVEVDEAIDLIELPLQGRIPAPDLGGKSGLLSSIVDYQGHLIRILDPEQLLRLDEIQDLEQSEFTEHTLQTLLANRD